MVERVRAVRWPIANVVAWVVIVLVLAFIVMRVLDQGQRLAVAEQRSEAYAEQLRKAGLEPQPAAPSPVPGRPGQDGAPGKTGPSGSPGRPGRDGRDGKEGAPGKTGPSGAPGASGAPGEQGAQGEQGLRGEKGDKGDEGPQGPAGPACADGYELQPRTIPTTDGPEEVLICTRKDSSP